MSEEGERPDFPRDAREVDRFRSLERIFHDVRRLPRERATQAVRERCGSDHELADEILRLLEKERSDALPVDSALSMLPSDLVRLVDDACGVEAPRRVPERIGPYRIRRILGRGGMGLVYEAEQEAPRREVALKLIDVRTATGEVTRRFRNEIEILGHLHHPGIAQIFDAGSVETELGSQPYFAMELIHGLPITEFADRQKLDGRGRLGLLASVCDAVQHAHDRGIVHRDLKPSNILVEDDGVPRVLDFGIARAGLDGIGLSLGQSMHTSPGQIVGTFAYMSPEHAAGRGDEIDARSDVYSLGVIAYELLTGHRPTPVEGRPVDEALRDIRELDPMPVGLFDRTLRGDVETIVRTALAKDPARRYQSAAAFASDIRSALRDLPIRARPPGWLDASVRFARRHRSLVATGTFAVVVLIAGAALALREAQRARIAERVAEEGRATAERRTEEAGRAAYRAGIAAALGEIQAGDGRSVSAS